MRFPVSSTAFNHYLDLLGLETQPFPNPLAPARRSTVIDLEGEPHYVESLDDLPQLFQEVAHAWARRARERVALHAHAGRHPGTRRGPA